MISLWRVVIFIDWQGHPFQNLPKIPGSVWIRPAKSAFSLCVTNSTPLFWKFRTLMSIVSFKKKNTPQKSPYPGRIRAVSIRPRPPYLNGLWGFTSTAPRTRVIQNHGTKQYEAWKLDPTRGMPTVELVLDTAPWKFEKTNGIFWLVGCLVVFWLVGWCCCF